MSEIQEFTFEWWCRLNKAHTDYPTYEVFDKQLKDQLAQAKADGQQNGVAWAIGVVDDLHLNFRGNTGLHDNLDGMFKGIKNTIRDRYKAETGIDPAPRYPVNVRLTTNEEKNDE